MRAADRKLTSDDLAQIAILKGRAQAQPFYHPAMSRAALIPHTADLSDGSRVIITVDHGHWFPNQDWQHCLHVSMSDPRTQLSEADQWQLLRAIFPEHLLSNLCHEHRLGSRVDHWRLFFTERGECIVPRGEAYTRRGTREYFEQRERAKAESVAVRSYQPEPER
jgi:hypothetical protein